MIDDDKLVTEIGTFVDIEKEILLNATGILSAREMAESFNISISEIEKIFYKLNDKCLVYMSEF